MRTTVRLDDELLRDTKRLAADTGRTLTAVIEDSLRETLARSRPRRPRRRIQLTTVPGPCRPGVDLDDSAGLRELMERGDAPA